MHGRAGRLELPDRCEQLFEGTGPSSTRDLPAVSGAGRGLGRIRPVVVMARPPFDWVVAASLPDASLPEPSPPEPSLLAAPMAGWRGHEVAHQDEHAGALAEDERALLDALVDKHLRKHGGACVVLKS